MLKNNLKYLLVGLIAPLLFVATCHAQTIGEIVEAAKSRELNNAAVMLPPASGFNRNEAQASIARTAPVVDSGAMIVTSIFTSKERNQAGISIGGAEVYLAPGDAVINNWVIDSISTTTVILKRCSVSKRCEIKKLHYTLTQ
jgi:hypothetical protein